MSSPVVTNSSAQLNGNWLVQSAPPVTLTDAQIKALPTTPITIIAAPGSGKRIKLLGATIQLNINVVYANVNTTLCALYFDIPHGTYMWGPAFVNDSSYATPLTQATAFLTNANHAVMDVTGPGLITAFDAGAASGVSEWVIPNAAGYPDAADVDNAPVRIVINNNSAGVLTGGDASNSMLVSVYYAIEAMI